MPGLLIQIALIIIVVRSVYVVVQRMNIRSKNWLDILFHLSIVVVALGFLF
jgi:hypothetical protein